MEYREPGKKGFAVITNLTDNSIELPEKIAAIKQKGYLVSYQREHKTNEQYIAFLARIGKHLILIIFLQIKKKISEIDEFFAAHFVKMHTSYRVEILKDGSFELSQLDGSYVKKLIEEKKIRISHETDADEII